MSSVVFATVCLIFLGAAVIGTVGFVLGYSTGRDRERARKCTEAFDKMADTVVDLVRMRPPPAPMGHGPQSPPAPPRIIEKPVRSGIFLGDDPDLDNGLDENGDDMIAMPRHTQSGVAESIPMNF